MNGSREPRVARWPQGVLLLLQATLGVVCTTALAPIIPQLMRQFSSVPNIGFWAPFVITAPSLTSVLAAPVLGWLADMIGRRRVIMGAVAAYAVLGIAPMFLFSLPLIIGSRLLLGTVEAGVLAISSAMIGDYFASPARETWLSYVITVSSVTAITSAMLGGLLGNFGWRWPFLCHLIAVPLLWGLWQLTWEPVQRQQVQNLSWQGFPWRRFIGAVAVALAVGIMFFVVQIDLSTALQALKVSLPSQAGALTALGLCGILAGSFGFRRVAHWHREWQFALAFGAAGAGFLLMAGAHWLGWFMAGVLINQLGCGMALPATLSWAMHLLGFQHRGRGMGIWQSVFSLGPVLGPGLASLVPQADGGLRGAFLLLGAAAVIIAGGSALMTSGKRGNPAS